MVNTTLPQARITIYCDGLCEPVNPGGYGCWGWLAVDLAGCTLGSDHGCIGKGAGITNNRAEYCAFIYALEYARQQRWRGMSVRSDSQLVINQVAGRWACNAPALQPLCTAARRLVEVTEAMLEWVPREQNAQADLLSRRAYDEARRAFPSMRHAEVHR
ncbi:MAG TPA: ribonuclease HI family protein [Herpetosiphonaceae bacterium]|nr:ribonuclease HI family protein [Herpetosiphonaceae bacterium]